MFRYRGHLSLKTRSRSNRWRSGQLFGLAVIGTIHKFSVLTEFRLSSGYLFQTSPGANRVSPFRLEIPFVGPPLVVSAFLLLGVIAAFSDLDL